MDVYHLLTFLIVVENLAEFSDEEKWAVGNVASSRILQSLGHC